MICQTVPIARRDSAYAAASEPPLDLREAEQSRQLLLSAQFAWAHARGDVAGLSIPL